MELLASRMAARRTSAQSVSKQKEHFRNLRLQTTELCDAIQRAVEQPLDLFLENVIEKGRTRRPEFHLLAPSVDYLCQVVTPRMLHALLNTGLEEVVLPDPAKERGKGGRGTSRLFSGEECCVIFAIYVMGAFYPIGPGLRVEIARALYPEKIRKCLSGELVNVYLMPQAAIALTEEEAKQIKIQIGLATRFPLELFVIPMVNQLVRIADNP